MGRRNNEYNDRRTEQYRKLFIGGLTPQTDEIRLKKYYEQWGELVDFVVMKDNKTGRSRGFGFVTYRDPQMVDEAQSNRPHEIDGKFVEAKRAMPREDSNTPESHMTVNKLFVGGLKKDINKDHLKSYFSKFGSVVDCAIVVWKNSGESRGFGFVTFDDYDPVDKAILYKPHQISSSKVDVKKALSKDEIDEIKRKQTIETNPNISAECYNVNLIKTANNFNQHSNITINSSNPTLTNTANFTYLPANIIYDTLNPQTLSNSTAAYYPTIGSPWNSTHMINPSFYVPPRPMSDLSHTSQYFTADPNNTSAGIPPQTLMSISNLMSSTPSTVYELQPNYAPQVSMRPINFDDASISSSSPDILPHSHSSSMNVSTNNIEIY